MGKGQGEEGVREKMRIGEVVGIEGGRCVY